MNHQRQMMHQGAESARCSRGGARSQSTQTNDDVWYPDEFYGTTRAAHAAHAEDAYKDYFSLMYLPRCGPPPPELVGREREIYLSAIVGAAIPHEAEDVICAPRNHHLACWGSYSADTSCSSSNDDDVEHPYMKLSELFSMTADLSLGGRRRGTDASSAEEDEEEGPQCSVLRARSTSPIITPPQKRWKPSSLFQISRFLNKKTSPEQRKRKTPGAASSSK